jgi:hypothetical protein
LPQKADFTPAEPWLGKPLAARDPEALVLSYLGAFGPAAAADVQTWSGLKGVKTVINGLGDRLETFADEGGRELFDLPGAPRPDEDAPAPPRFLPEFENMVLSHSDRTRVLADEHRQAVVTKNLRVRATFLWDGFVTGPGRSSARRRRRRSTWRPSESSPRTWCKRSSVRRLAAQAASSCSASSSSGWSRSSRSGSIARAAR